MKELIEIDSNGVAILPKWVYQALLRKSGIKSKKKRIQNKVIKREFIKLLKEIV